MPRSKIFSRFSDDPLWYKDAIIYELYVRAFYDSDGNGIGDFRGLIEKLDYLQDLGVTTVWLLPFYPSPLKDDGYDIADYNDVNPIYGTLPDFREFVREAHERNLRVLTEMVCNHTSDQHAWFQRARRARPGSPERNFYVWSDTPDKYKEARIIFKDFETSNWSWDPVANAYFWHRFYSSQPDLNFDNPAVGRAILRAFEFWLNMGVDAIRLDAIPYLFEREGTNCENLPETHEFLKYLRAQVDKKFPNRMFLAEANQWPEDAVQYFGNGDECHMCFHFPVMPRLFMATQMEDRFPIIDIMAQTPPIPDTCQWGMFLRNHDELTLEMVTDEERDYMYRVYAHDPRARINVGIRRRLAPLLGNHRRKIELMNGLLFSLPGTPCLYYGDEIGMGDNIYLGDRDGVRTPMQWSPDRNAGFSRANPQRLYSPVIIDPEYHYETVNVESQQGNPHSLLWWMKRLIALRKRYRAFGRGSLEFLHPDNRKVLAFVRRFENEIILVVANLSRFAQAAELDLRPFQGLMPVEMFGRVEFPAIGDLPYFITLGPHSFYWFTLEPQPAIEIGQAVEEIPVIQWTGEWRAVLGPDGSDMMEHVLPRFVSRQRWFGGGERRIRSTRVRDALLLLDADSRQYLTLIQVQFNEGDPLQYFVGISHAEGDRANELLQKFPQNVIARLQGRAGEDLGILYDATAEREFAGAILKLLEARRRWRTEGGDFWSARAKGARGLYGTGEGSLEPTEVRLELNNASTVFSNRLILKMLHRAEEGPNPDVELSEFLHQQGFEHTRRLAGLIEYRATGGQPMSVAMLQSFVPNAVPAWRYTLDDLGHFYERTLTSGQAPPEGLGLGAAALLDRAGLPTPELAHELIGPYLESVRLLGQRTAEMHLALASSPDDPVFGPEPFTTLYQRSVYQSMRTRSLQVLPALRRALNRLPASVRPFGEQAAALEPKIRERFQALTKAKIAALRIRHHADYQLANVLYTGKDFVITNFDGGASQPVSEERIKRSPMRDVAGMLRSFQYAAFGAWLGLTAGGVARVEDRPPLEPWARFWCASVSAAFLRCYLETMGESGLIPKGREELEILLDGFLLDRAVGQIRDELGGRPDWLEVPLRGLIELLGQP